mmetsp:Transcript_14673/g.27583  ORF Transcript_14673/g.27583 Transcript_14673/m.27583 type:complete len:280 (-) Transcript_14673:51-890(-)
MHLWRMLRGGEQLGPSVPAWKWKRHSPQAIAPTWLVANGGAPCLHRRTHKQHAGPVAPASPTNCSFFLAGWPGSPWPSVAAPPDDETGAAPAPDLRSLVWPPPARWPTALASLPTDIWHPRRGPVLHPDCLWESAVQMNSCCPSPAGEHLIERSETSAQEPCMPQPCKACKPAEGLCHHQASAQGSANSRHKRIFRRCGSGAGAAAVAAPRAHCRLNSSPHPHPIGLERRSNHHGSLNTLAQMAQTEAASLRPSRSALTNGAQFPASARLQGQSTGPNP